MLETVLSHLKWSPSDSPLKNVSFGGGGGGAKLGSQTQISDFSVLTDKNCVPSNKIAPKPLRGLGKSMVVFRLFENLELR